MLFHPFSSSRFVEILMIKIIDLDQLNINVLDQEQNMNNSLIQFWIKLYQLAKNHNNFQQFPFKSSHQFSKHEILVQRMCKTGKWKYQK